MPPLPPFDRVPLVRRAPQALARRREDVVLFESWHGRYSDSPRAISEELARREAPFTHVWAVDEPTGDLPPGAVMVRPGSAAYLAALGQARYIVANSSLPGYFRKRRHTGYLQTWHGTPLKRIAFDIDRPTFAGSKKYLKGLSRDVASWDHLVSPNRFSTEIFRRAFRYDGEILETGYPRNDVLLSRAAGGIRRRVRKQLGIPDGARAVLYAPTWRDDARFSSGLGLDALGAELGDGFVLLLRAHQLVASTVELSPGSGIRNVSDHPDVSELYLAADVLITDYSSVMFDFAVTGRPMLFFTYDLARYRDELRGFYFDFETEAPGPLLAKTGDVVDALRDIEGVAAAHAVRYEQFAERFCSLEDGGASQRVVDLVFSS